MFNTKRTQKNQKVNKARPLLYDKTKSIKSIHKSNENNAKGRNMTMYHTRWIVAWIEGSYVENMHTV